VLAAYGIWEFPLKMGGENILKLLPSLGLHPVINCESSQLAHYSNLNRLHQVDHLSVFLFLQTHLFFFDALVLL
jgi:hypothetical protein